MKDTLVSLNGDPSWPLPQLRTRSASGARGNLKFAFFADKRRLLIARAGEWTLYDCGKHVVNVISADSGGGVAAFYESSSCDR